MLATILAVLPAGCWDSEEIDTLFIVTGIALDLSDNPEEMNITVQVGKVQQESSGSQGTNMEKNSSLLLKTAGDTVMEAGRDNRDSSHNLLSTKPGDLLGTALTEEESSPTSNLFLRGLRAPLEVALAMVEGGGGEGPFAKLMQEPSGILWPGCLRIWQRCRCKYRVRLIDSLQAAGGNHRAGLPIVAVTGEGGNRGIKLTGIGGLYGDG